MRKSINEKYILLLSHLTRGAWIEINRLIFPNGHSVSHLTRGAWIEIDVDYETYLWLGGRTSHEVRGLKSPVYQFIPCGIKSHLTRGAWIEIMSNALAKSSSRGRTSHEVRGLK